MCNNYWQAKKMDLFIGLTILISISVNAFLVYEYSLGLNISLNWLVNLLIFIVLNAINEIFSIHLPKGGNVSVAFAIDIAVIYLFEPIMPVIIATTGYIINYLSKKEFNSRKFIFNIGQISLSLAVASMFYAIYKNEINNILALALAALLNSLINITLVTFIVSLNNKQTVYNTFMTNFKWVIPNLLALTPMGILMAKIYEAWGALGIFMFILPLMLARQTFKLYMDTRQMYLDTVQALVTAIEAKDLYTKGHSERVAEFAVETARELEWPEHKIETLRYMALLHDIGKIAIPDLILNKSTKLSPQEYDRIKDHAAIGAEILKQVKNLGDAHLMVRHHHERMDGSGYPDRLAGEEIPMGARIIAVADCFDAMTSNRVYRAGRAPQEAIRELLESGGKELDSQVVQAFAQAWRKRLAAKWEKQILTEIETGVARGEVAAAQAEE